MKIFYIFLLVSIVSIVSCKTISVPPQKYLNILNIPSDTEVKFTINVTDIGDDISAGITSVSKWKLCQQHDFKECKFYSRYSYVNKKYISDTFTYLTDDSVLVVYSNNQVFSVEITLDYKFIDKSNEVAGAGLVIIITTIILFICVPICILAIVIGLPVTIIILLVIIFIKMISGKSSSESRPYNMVIYPDQV